MARLAVGFHVEFRRSVVCVVMNFAAFGALQSHTGVFVKWITEECVPLA